MTDLLTTKQVQALLKVDRTTIYRMVENGQLPAVRVGKQWRFGREQVETWLRNGRPGGAASSNVSEREHRPQPATFNLQTRSAHAAREGTDLRELLAMPCTQLIQDAFADILGVMIVITDMHGQPVTRVSNPSGFFSALTSDSPRAISQCVVAWQQFANQPALEPKWALNEMGLLCTRGWIRVGSELKGMVVLGGLAPEGWPPRDEQVAALARQFGAEPSGVIARVATVHRLDAAGQDKALRSVQRFADLLAHMIEERTDVQAQMDALRAQIRGQA